MDKLVDHPEWADWAVGTCKCSHEYRYHVAIERDPHDGKLTGREQCTHPMCGCLMYLETK